ncbi:MAG: hypothetical protein AB1758_33315 [Candidatus Eremiobacterota bacterium]
MNTVARYRMTQIGTWMLFASNLGLVTASAAGVGVVLLGHMGLLGHVERLMLVCWLVSLAAPLFLLWFPESSARNLMVASIGCSLVAAGGGLLPGVCGLASTFLSLGFMVSASVHIGCHDLADHFAGVGRGYLWTLGLAVAGLLVPPLVMAAAVVFLLAGLRYLAALASLARRMA